MIFKWYFVFFILILYFCCLTETALQPQKKRLAMGYQFFKRIIDENRTYVDKTMYALKLISPRHSAVDASHIFMNRPRRFGKSLFLDTLKEIAEGNKHLFNGCEISKTDYEWPKYHVLLLDFSSIGHHQPGLLEKELIFELMDVAEENNIRIDETRGMGSILKYILKKLSNRKNMNSPSVVVLIDEYDHPIVHHFKERTLLEENAKVIQAFFTFLKSQGRYIRLTFVMGVTKFALTSVYSGANHLTDISMYEEFDTMFGFTHEEIINNFPDYIENVARDRAERGIITNKSQAIIMNEIKNWYNGYHFSTNTTESRSVYNPWSIINYFRTGNADHYWLQTGPSTIGSGAFELYSEEELYAYCFGPPIKLHGSDLKSAYDIYTVRLPIFLFQTGYLTISYYDQAKDQYHLTFPNSEVELGLLQKLVQEKITMKLEEPATKQAFDNLKEYLEIDRLDLDTFFTRVNEMFSSIPHCLYIPTCTEKGFHMTLHIFLKMALPDFNVASEFHVHTGSIDILLTTQNLFMIIEVKMDKSTRAAMKQIDDRKYKTCFHNQDKFIALVGINFDTKARKMEWVVKYCNPKGEEIAHVSVGNIQNALNKESVENI